MGIYISSSGEQKETNEMAQSYLERALAKAKREGNDANVEILQEELDSRK